MGANNEMIHVSFDYRNINWFSLSCRELNDFHHIQGNATKVTSFEAQYICNSLAHLQLRSDQYVVCMREPNWRKAYLNEDTRIAVIPGDDNALLTVKTEKTHHHNAYLQYDSRVLLKRRIPPSLW